MKPARKVGFAVVGLGSIARGSVLPAFRHSKRAKLVALVSRDLRKAEKLKRNFNPEAAYSASDLEACLANPNVTAVYLATPQCEHLSATVADAYAGKHILCEKPLARNTGESAEMVRICESPGVQLMTAYRKHFEPSTLFLKDLIRSGRLGKMDLIHTSFSELHVPGRSIPWLVHGRAIWRRPAHGPGHLLREHHPLARGRRSCRSDRPLLEESCGVLP
jgi:predicted dehydrogenase